MSVIPLSITIPEELLEKVKKKITKGEFASVSEFVREAVREKLTTDAEASRSIRSSNRMMIGEVGGGMVQQHSHEDQNGQTRMASSTKSSSDKSAVEHKTITNVVVFNILEHPWITGKVERGQQLGGQLGFPTLNLDPFLLPSDMPFGVYAAEVEVADVIHRSAAHYGPRKTLGEWKPTLEFHLLDFNQHIPGHLVRFRIFKKIRDTIRFESLDQLKAQLKIDVQQVREYFEKQH